MSQPLSLLDQLTSLEKIRSFSISQLEILSEEVRADLINSVSKTGGHLGAGLGVVELTVALHHVFNTPQDRLIWDVGHQSYPHKILTGRRHLMGTLRQKNGLSGFPKRAESPYDAFGTGHSSTSISAALGMAVARDHKGDDFATVAVIGDGAMSAGMAYEAMNNAGSLRSKLIVILNDNDMSIAKPVGAMSTYLSRLISSRSYHSFRVIAKEMAKHLPKSLEDMARRAEEYARGLVTGGTLFEELGFYYVGPLDGHNLTHLIPILKNIRDAKEPGPYLIHVVTEKGKGYEPAKNFPEKLHATGQFDVVTGRPSQTSSMKASYTKIFAESLIQEANVDPKILAITAAMPSGTGLDLFGKAHPDRCYDVGIAEQHAVTFAAGLACEGMKPFVAIYSTFLQRAYDQVIHDVALQNLPVRFVLDRAGLVGADGATHVGAFDIAYLGCIPNMVLMAASDEVELKHMVATLAAYDQGPCALRFPRGEISGALSMPDRGEPLALGKGRLLGEGGHVAILSYGTRLADCLIAAQKIEQDFPLTVTVADGRFAKPLDEDLIRQLVAHHKVLLTVEEGSQGGFGARVMHFLAQEGSFDRGLCFRSMTLPDRFQDQAAQADQWEEAHLSAKSIVETILKALPPGFSLQLVPNKGVS